MKLLDELIQDLENSLSGQRDELGEDSPALHQIEIKILGQMSLLMNDQVSSQLNLVMTKDLDAILGGTWSEAQVFREVLKLRGLEYDELSKEIWIPNGARFIDYYESPYVKVTYLDPISALTSKAIKAKEKNKGLITAALMVFGEPLAHEIEANGGDLSYFTPSNKLQL